MAYLNQPMDFGAAPNFGQQIAMPRPAPKKGGMFGSGVGTGEFIQALLSGYLAAGGNPAGVAGMQMLNQRRQARDEEAQYQRQRGDKLADYAEMQKIQAQYGAPAQPHYFEDNAGNLMAVGPDGQPRMVHKDPLQWKLVPNGMGGVVPVNIGQLMGQQGPQGLPQTLSDDDWQGGPTPSASGGFRSPY